MGKYEDAGREADELIANLVEQISNINNALKNAHGSVTLITSRFHKIEELVEILRQQAETATWEYNELKKENARLKAGTPEEPKDGPEHYA